MLNLSKLIVERNTFILFTPLLTIRGTQKEKLLGSSKWFVTYNETEWEQSSKQWQNRLEKYVVLCYISSLKSHMIGLCEKQIQMPSSPPMQLSNIIHMQIKNDAFCQDWQAWCQTHWHAAKHGFLVHLN